ncbi:MAG: FimB/Mfa2 family fimbrial subunit [Prevotella sp.]
MRAVSFISILLLVLVSCEKIADEDYGATESGNLHITALIITQEPFGQDANISTKATTPLANLCTRISFVLYQNGSRVKYINQTADKEGFGTVSFDVEAGEYKLLVIGHSGTANATTTDINKISFSGKLTDTFVFCDDIVVGDEKTTITTELTRVVAMVRLDITGNIPSNVSRFKFYYTGGSSTLDAETKQGCVESRQTEYRDVSPTVKEYDVYTFPHESDDILQMTISALDANSEVIAERRFTDLPITLNMITRMSCDFFDGSGAQQENTFTTIADDEWAGFIEYVSE